MDDNPAMGIAGECLTARDPAGQINTNHRHIDMGPVPTDKWEPVLEGDAAASCWEAIHDVVADLATNPRVVHPMNVGPALLNAYLSVATSDAEARHRCEALLDTAVDSLAKGVHSLGLFNEGLTGLGWLVSHVGRLLNLDIEDAVSEVDEAVRNCCRRPLIDYDLINGAVGLGVYCLERRPVLNDVIQDIVSGLQYRAERRGIGVSWHTSANLLAPMYKRMCPDGYYNLGVAHGVPGIIGFLAQLQLHGLLEPAGVELLDQACRWVLSRRTSNDSLPNWEPANSGGGQHSEGEPRSIWCYGPLGASVVLLNVATATENWLIEGEALRMAASAAMRRNRETDACLCHGAASAAHLFNRLFQVTRSEEFRDAAGEQCRLVLDMRIKGRGIGGFVSVRPYDQEGKRVADPVHVDGSFLEGASGTALALLAAVSHQKPAWDALLLLSS